MAKHRDRAARGGQRLGEEIDAAFRVVGAFTDLKSYWLRGHAEGTSELAEAAAWRLGLQGVEVTMARRAALALDLGRVAVSNAIWEKPGPFSLTDWERVQLHPYFTERSFAHAPALASIGEPSRTAQRRGLPPQDPGFFLNVPGRSRAWWTAAPAATSGTGRGMHGGRSGSHQRRGRIGHV